MKTPLRFAFIVLFLVMAGSCLAQTATIAGGTTFQVFDGMGVAQAFSGSTSTTPITTEFSPTGVGLKYLRLQIYPDNADCVAKEGGSCTSAAGGGTISNFDLAVAQAAVAQGAIVWATEWSPPASMKTNGSFQGTGNMIGNSTNYTNLAAIQASFVTMMVANGVPIYAVSAQNEPDITVSYQACLWTAAQIHDYVPFLRTALNSAGFAATKVMIAEPGHWTNTLATTAMNDATVAGQVGVLAGHAYSNTGSGPVNPPSNLSYSNITSQHQWETEVADNGAYDGSMTSGLTYAFSIHQFLTIANASAWHYWLATDAAGRGDNSALTNSSYSIAKRAWVMGNWGRFASGMTRISATANPQTNVLVTAFKNTTTGAFTIVAINQGSAISQTFSSTGLAATSVTPWITDATRNLAAQTTIPFSSGFTATLAAQSVTSFVSAGSGSTTVNAATCNPADIATAFSSITSVTTTLNIPAGTCNWTTTLSTSIPSSNANLTIQGQTVVTCTGTPNTSSYACISTDNTIINDNIAGGGTSPWTIAMPGKAAFVNITGLTIQGGTGGVKNNGMLQINGPNDNLRIHHNHFKVASYSGGGSFTGRLFGEVAGVIDHNIFDNEPTTSGVSQGFAFSNPFNDTIGDGDGPWAAATMWGSLNQMYEEDNIFNNGEVGDCDTGGNFVARFNTINGGSTGSAPIHQHGTKTQAGIGRGCREYEAYKNYFNGPVSNLDAAFGEAAGPALIWGNTIPRGFNWGLAASTTRSDGSATETNPPNGWGYCGTTVNGNGVGSVWDQNVNPANGYRCLDGVGAGKGDALNGAGTFATRKNTVTNSQSWPHQLFEPTYLWGNSFGAAAYARINSGDIATKIGTDIQVEPGVVTSPTNTCTGTFNGTCGTGQGLLSARPTTCTPGPGGANYTSPTGSYGVGYFSTDANGGLGKLSVCTATNFWTDIYTPLVHPHPLVSGTPQASAPAFSPVPGTFGSAQSITVTDATPSSTIFYTTDGSTPTTSSSVYFSPIAISVTSTLQAMATAPGFTQSATTSGVYTISGSACANPSQNAPFSGTYAAGSYTITWTNPTAGCALRYTTDGSAPTVASPTYPGGGLVITSTTTIRVIATQTGFTSSAIQGGTWTITSSSAATPTFLPVSPYTGGAISVTISSTTPASSISYCFDTLNTCVPGTAYVGPVSFASTGFIRAFANAAGFSQSTTSSWQGTFPGPPIAAQSAIQNSGFSHSIIH